MSCVAGASANLILDQPHLTTQPQYSRNDAPPATSHSTKSQHWFTSGHMDHSTARRPWTSHSHKKWKIGAPTDFRRINEMPKRRHSFSPLELSIYVLPGRTLSPLPDFSVVEWGVPTNVQKPATAMLAEEKEGDQAHAYTESIMSWSSFQVPRKPISAFSVQGETHRRYDSCASVSMSDVGEDSTASANHGLLNDLDPTPIAGCLQPLPVAVSPDLHQSRRRTSGSSSSSRIQTPTTRSRSATESSSRRSSIRRVKTDVEEAIRELNTIVEEKRMDAFRAASQNSAAKLELKTARTAAPKTRHGDVEASPTSPELPSPHVPAIVPTMKVHARSQTLSDIGSAFSTPLTGKYHHAKHSTDTFDAMASEESLVNNNQRAVAEAHDPDGSQIITTSLPSGPWSFESTKSRVSGWLRKSMLVSFGPVKEDAETIYGNPTERNRSSNYQSEAALPVHRLKQEASSSTLPSFVPTLDGDLHPIGSSPTLVNSSPKGLTNEISRLASMATSDPVNQDLPFAVHLEKRAGKAATGTRYRGLSIGTVNGVPPPPAYEELDPHPKNNGYSVGQRTFGLAY